MMTAVSDSVGEEVLYEGYDRMREAHENFDDRYPELHEKNMEAVSAALNKRSEINTALCEREDARSARLAAPEGKISDTLRHNVVHERIIRAYPHLADGERTGSYFKRIISAADHRKKTQKSDKTKKSDGKREV